MCLLPSNVPAYSRLPHKNIDRGTAIEDPIGNDPERVHTQVSVVVGKGKKRVLTSFDPDSGDGGKQKKIRLVADDGDIEMND